MKYLVTGNLGYVGSVLCPHIRAVEPEADVNGVDAGFFAHCLVTHAPLPERLINQQFFGDVRHPSESWFDGVDAVIHLAAVSNDPMGVRFEQATESINLGGTLAVARMAKEKGVKRFVFASSCSVYGEAGPEARSEESAVNPLTAYARSKVAAERALAALAGDEFVITCLRFATACGPSPRLRLDLVLNDFVSSAVNKSAIDILSDGTPWRPLIDVRDMARALHWGATRRAEAGGKFLIVNTGAANANYQVKELADAVKEQVTCDVRVNANAQPDKRSYRVSFDKFAEIAPEAQPLHEVTASIAALAKQVGMTPEPAQYKRLTVLDELCAGGQLTSDLQWDRK